ncbi:MAG: hypothetical protein FJ306_09990, partial [Planctomycetes bacterium]|nr:hypothetical protein [Planctomycetota bacterium]
MQHPIHIPTLFLAAMAALTPTTIAQSLQLDFQDGVGAWSTVLDGVMGGLSTGKVSQPQPGVLRFTGELSLENNGGFSQMRTAVREGACAGARGFVLEVKGDGRTYTFDVRASNARVMAGSFQQKFDTTAGEWTRIELPLERFRLYSFGRELRDAAPLDAAKVESVGVTLADKKAGAFALDVRSIATYGATAPAASGDGGLAAVAGRAGLTKLLACVGASGLELPEGPVTILAPTDAAFDALPAGVVESLLRPENKAKLRTILLQHVTEGRLSSAALLNQRSLATLAGQQLAVDFARQQVGGAGFVATDVPFDGGLVHVVDKVLLPESRSIVELAVASDQLKTLVTAVKAAGLVDQLGAENGPWTVFAPIDSAFAKLPKATLEQLLQPANRAALTGILGLHVVPGRIAARELLQKQKLTTLMGNPIATRLVGGKLTIGGAGFVATDVQAGNGVIHLIDTVITEPLGGAESGANARARAGGGASDGDVFPGLRAIYELAVDRGVPLFNRGEVEGCAAVYEVAVQSALRLARGRIAPELLSELETAASKAATLP